MILTTLMDIGRHSSLTQADHVIRKFGLITMGDHEWHHSRELHDTNFGANWKIWDHLHQTGFSKLERPPLMGREKNLSFKEVLTLSTNSEETDGMSSLGVVMSLFPLSLLLTVISLIGISVALASPIYLAAALGTLYLAPLLSFRIHNFFYPLKVGLTKISGSNYSIWWGTHQLQLIFIALPSLEALLMCVPGLFSLWLRAWGSKVGRNIHWTATLRVADRSLLEVGDGVVIGHKVEIYGHVIKNKNEKMILYTQKVKIGNSAFVGAGSYIGPGAQIDAHVQLPVQSEVAVNQRVLSLDH